jgi:hypothetical protein
MIGAHVYVYVFGDRIGQIGLSGLGFSCGCAPSGTSEPGGGVPGAALMYRWYLDNRASKRKDPILVTLGNITLEGFVKEFTENVVDTQSGIMQWDLTMLSLPQDN